MVRPTTVSTNSLTNEAGGRLTVGGTIDLIGNTNNLAQLDINASAGSGTPASCGILDAENYALKEFASGQITSIGTKFRIAVRRPARIVPIRQATTPLPD
jgi:hypothetical protein